MTASASWRGGMQKACGNGNDFTARFPLVVAAIMALPVRSYLIDGSHPRVISV